MRSCMFFGPKFVFHNNTYCTHLLVREHGVVLKRKLQQAELDLPSKKRLCLYHTPLFSPLPAVLDTRMTLVNMEASVSHVDILPCPD